MIPMKLRGTVRAGTLSLALALAACGTPSPQPVTPPVVSTSLPAIVASPQGQSVITALTQNFAPGVNAAIANVSAKVASSSDAEFVGEALSWAPTALSIFGSASGLSAQTVAALSAGATSASAALKNPPTTLANAIADALGAYQAVTAALKPALGT